MTQDCLLASQQIKAVLCLEIMLTTVHLTSIHQASTFSQLSAQLMHSLGYGKWSVKTKKNFEHLSRVAENYYKIQQMN